MTNGRYGLFLLLLLTAGTLQAQPFDLQIKGLEAALQKNVNDHLLSIVHHDDVVLDSRLKAQLEQGIRGALRAKGYYEPQIELQFSNLKNSRRALVTAHVTPGKPIYIAGIKVTINGHAEQDTDYQKLLQEAVPTIGEILDHGKFDNFVARLSDLASDNGYFDAVIATSELQVAPTRHQAFWNIIFTSGKRYHFGPVTIHGSSIEPAMLQSLIPFKVGDPYTLGAVMELNSRLSATQWVSAVAVTPQFDQVDNSSALFPQLPILATVTPRKGNVVETGVRYDTEVGPGIRLNWKKPWINRLGHRLECHLNISRPAQKLHFGYHIPLQKEPLEQYYLIEAGYLAKRQNDTVAREITTELTRYWGPINGWRPAIHLHRRYDHFTQGGQTLTTHLLYPGVSFSRVRQHGGLMPDWGDSQRFSVDLSSRRWGSSVNFSYFKMQSIWIRTPWQHHRWLMRLNTAWINTDNFPMVPASLRLFAGGEGSIRGYGHHTISPKDEQGKLIGASRLATGSLEYNYQLSRGWWLALFADSGAAVDKYVRADLHTGVGAGLRWDSPLGPIKLNVAKAVNNFRHKNLYFSISFGSEL